MNRKKMVAGFWVVILVASALAYASTIKVWSSGEALRPSDLNDNFAHIHNLMVGGHGARLVNADVSASAAIAQSKIANSDRFSDGWAFVAASCTSASCTIAASSTSLFSGIARSSEGIYTATFASARVDANYAINVTPQCSFSAFNSGVACNVVAQTTTAFTFHCYETSWFAYGGSATDGGTPQADCGFSISYFDEN